VNGPAVWVKVEGKGSFLNSGNLKEFAREMVDRGYREFVIDLENCAMMDSTFMGTMAGVALRLKELGRGHLHIVHCGNRSRDLLSGLGLDQIFSIHGNGSSAPKYGALQRDSKGELPEEKKHEQAQTMLEAVSRATGLALVGDSLRAAAAEVRADVDGQVDRSEEIASVVRALEEQYDAYVAGRGENLLASDTGPLPTADELGAELERFLAEQTRDDS